MERSYFEVLHECFHAKGSLFPCRNCNQTFCSHANLKYHMDFFIGEKSPFINEIGISNVPESNIKLTNS